MTPASSFDASERRQLLERGVSLDEALRQIELLGKPPAYADLSGACTVEDGILRLADDEVTELQRLHGKAAREGRFLKFVPASGAASRMFRELLRFRGETGSRLDEETIRQRAEQGGRDEQVLVRFLNDLQRFAFHEDLARVLQDKTDRDSVPAILEALLGAEGLDYARSPKGVLKFHAYPEGNRTPTEEQLVEAVHHAKDGQGRCRIHFTVSPGHDARFSSRLRAVQAEYERRFGARFVIDFSEQKPSTDTLAADLDGRPLRDERQGLVFRPGGHGALIENLNDLQGDLVYVKNIDNVQPDRLKEPGLTWKRTLGGLVVKTQHEVFDLIRALREPEPSPPLLDQATRFVRERLGVAWDGKVLPATFQCQRAFLLDRLNRPLRVCGVVPNTGEPGGGPFRVRQPSGIVGPQIVETAQIDPADAAQQAILGSSTHFNPVDLVCGVRDLDGRPFDLRRFIDEQAVIVAQKSAGGRDLRALERPGLWNGAMAGWNTIFVEVPLATFSPVKSVLDLLRPEHQPA